MPNAAPATAWPERKTAAPGPGVTTPTANWGDNNDGELGDGTLTGFDLNAPATALGINLN
jgi:hypothetical protein